VEDDARRRVVRRLVIAASMLVGLLLIGTAGYNQIVGMAPVDALYMTVITISTVGFGEIAPLNEAGRLFTIILIVGGGGIAAYALSTVAESLVTTDWRTHYEEWRRKSMLNSLSDHTIVCGYGRVGRHVADELHAQNIPFVVIDMSDEQVARVRKLGYLALRGNAANEEHLREAGIERANSLVATASSDAENVFIVLTARAIREDLVIVARANFDESEVKLLRAGATRVILPYRICGRRMAALLTRPGVADFFDEVMHTNNLELLVDQIEIRSGSALAGQTIADLDLRSRMGITVLACRMPGKPMNTSPGADTLISVGGTLIVLGTRENLQILANQAG
jgi:voltage-gated potassium channel